MGYFDLPLAGDQISDRQYHFDEMQVLFTVQSETADEAVKTLPIDSRKCKFPEENEGMWTFDYYSYGACTTQCKVEKKLELCNCTDKQVGFAKGT